MLDASLSRIDSADLLAALDPLGRLLASSRLLDMVLKNQDDVRRCVDAFFVAIMTFFRASARIFRRRFTCTSETGDAYLMAAGCSLSRTVPSGGCRLRDGFPA
jgi:hypothetical protein